MKNSIQELSSALSAFKGGCGSVRVAVRGSNPDGVGAWHENGDVRITEPAEGTRWVKISREEGAELAFLILAGRGAAAVRRVGDMMPDSYPVNGFDF